MEDTELEEGKVSSYQKENFNFNILKYVENSVKIPLETELLHFILISLGIVILLSTFSSPFFAKFYLTSPSYSL